MVCRHGGGDLLSPSSPRCTTRSGLRGPSAATCRCSTAPRPPISRRCGRARCGCSRPRGSATASLFELVLRHEQQHSETMLQAIVLARLLPAALRGDPRPGARRPHRPGVRARPRRAVHARRRPLRLLLRQRAPAPPRRAARLPDRPHAGHQRHLADLRRGRWLRRREWWSDEGWSWKEDYDITHPGSWARGPAAGSSGALTAGRRWTPKSRSSTCPGSRPMPSPEHGARLPTEAEQENADWDQAAEGPLGTRGATSPRARTAPTSARRASARTGGRAPRGVSPCGALGMLGDVWGVDGDRVPRLRRLRRAPLPRVLRGLLRRGLPGAARRLVGQPRARDDRDDAELGPPAAPADLLRVRLAWD